MNVFFHTCKPGEAWSGGSEGEWPRLPAVGEHVMLEQRGTVYRVTLVLHLFWRRDGTDVEVYAVETSISSEIGAAAEVVGNQLEAET